MRGSTLRDLKKGLISACVIDLSAYGVIELPACVIDLLPSKMLVYPACGSTPNSLDSPSAVERAAFTLHA